MSRVPTRRRARWIASLTAGVLAVGTASLAVPLTTAADAATDGHGGLAAPSRAAHPDPDEVAAEGSDRVGIPTSGRYTFLLALETPSTGRVFAAKRSEGRAVAGTAARSQLDAVTDAADEVVDDLPADTSVLYRTHAALAAVAVSTDVANLDQLAGIPGVTKVYPVAPKSRDNSYAVPLQGAPAAWAGDADLGADTTIGIVDTGIDFTHANFGGAGTRPAYETEHAHADDAAMSGSSVFPTAKVVGGWDLVGDAYNAAGSGAALTPHPDPNPLDCAAAGHGSHVAGSAAGLGVTAGGAPYAGAYDTTTDFDSMRIGPGMAPRAKLLAFRVFGCTGSTNVTAAGIDRALDPDGDGSTSDAVDVLNLSLGSPYGSTDDGDTAVADAASLLGVTMVFSAGNSFDLYDVGGSPGTSRRAITVAASADAQTMVDRLDLGYSLGGTAAMATSRALNYDWADDTDLAGQLVIPTGDDSGCSSLAGSGISGKVALLTFAWNGTAGTPCGSAARANNVAAAGGLGYVFTSSDATFSTLISGNAIVPGVMVTSGDGAAIRSKISAGNVVTVGGTRTNGFAQLEPSADDTMTDFSSRGMRGAGHLKPDVTAVGGTVLSTAAGTGNEGKTLSGTSMAAPMVAGLSALVVSAHPDWTPEQVKADIMNTAGQDLDTNGSDAPGGDRYAPNRVGAGRIQADKALTNDVLAYVVDDPGAVSVSFGPVEVTEPMTLTKTVKVQNTGTSARTYATSYDAITSVPGVSYLVSPASVSLAAGESTSVIVTFSVTDPSLMTKTVDPTHGRMGGSQPLESLADASGNLLLTPTSGGVPELRVPVYSAPRPASVMSQAATLGLSAGEGTLTLDGQDVDQGSGLTKVTSLVAGLELQATSPLAPACTIGVTAYCVSGPTDLGADLKYVGVTSDAPYYASPSNGQAYFGIVTHGAHSTAASKVTFQVRLDTDGNGAPDLIASSTRLTNSDVFVTTLLRVSNNTVLDVELTNNRYGDIDTAIFDSDVLLMPVWLDELKAFGINAASPRVSYGVVSSADNTVDRVGLDEAGLVDGSLSANLYEPGVLVSGGGATSLPSGANTEFGPLVKDLDGESLDVVRGASYAADDGQGLLMLHFHNKVGAKAQVVELKSTATVTMDLDAATVTRGNQTELKVTVDDPDDGGTPTGHVDVTDETSGDVVASGTVTGGVATLAYIPTVGGSQQLSATYTGDDTYAPAVSTPVTLTIAPSANAVTLGLSSASIERGSTVALTVGVTHGPGDPAPTGPVTVTDADTDAVVATGSLTGGVAALTYTPLTVGVRHLVASFVGDDSYAAGSSVAAALSVTPASRAVTLGVTPATVVRGSAVSLTIGVAHSGGDPTPTGAVSVVDGAGTTVASGALGVGGTVTLSFKPTTPGTRTLRATYVGDASTHAGSTVPVSLTVTRATPKPTLSLPSAKGKVGVKVKVRVAVPTVLGILATGKVVLKAGSKTVGTATLSGGKATFTFKVKKPGKVSIQVSYAGDVTYSSGISVKKTYTATKKPKRKKR